MYTLEELQPLILEWAKNKDLLKEENAPKQRLKLIEECGELANAILKNKIDEQKDAIGDIFVVLVILFSQIGEDLFLLSNGEFSPKNEDVLIYGIIGYSFTEYNKLDRNSPLEWLTELSNKLSLDITECANLAWNEIKDRKGKTIDGTFIKESELPEFPKDTHS